MRAVHDVSDGESPTQICLARRGHHSRRSGDCGDRSVRSRIAWGKAVTACTISSAPSFGVLFIIHAVITCIRDCTHLRRLVKHKVRAV